MKRSGFTKLHGSIIMSSIWDEDDQTRIVWMTMLALADMDGVVDGTVPGLARAAKVPIAATERALEKLMAPDQYSRTKDHDGRRIEEVDGGWLLLNHGKYREKVSVEDQRERKARNKRDQRKREREKQATQKSVTTSGDMSPMSPQAEAEAEAEAETEAAAAAAKEAGECEGKAAAAAADFLGMIPSQDMGPVAYAANRLVKMRPKLQRDWVWKSMAVLEAATRGKANDVLDKIEDKDVRRVKPYVDACVRGVCEDRGTTSTIAMALVPPTPPPSGTKPGEDQADAMREAGGL